MRMLPSGSTSPACRALPDFGSRRSWGGAQDLAEMQQALEADVRDEVKRGVTKWNVSSMARFHDT